MNQPSSSPRSDPNAPKPEYTPPPGDVPKRFPEKQPLSDDGVEAAKSKSASEITPPDHAGEDRQVESGIDRDDPEQARAADGDEAMK